MHVPQKFFDLFPLDPVNCPVIKAGDAADTHYADVFDAEVRRACATSGCSRNRIPTMEAGDQRLHPGLPRLRGRGGRLHRPGRRRGGRSPFKDNTIIIVTSDHGWNMGEKDYLFKNSPWEESTRVPFIVRAPGVARRRRRWRSIPFH